MKVERVSEYEYRLLFDKDECIFLENEAKDNSMTIIDMLLMLIGMLFIAGYKVIVGKD